MKTKLSNAEVDRVRGRNMICFCTLGLHRCSEIGCRSMRSGSMNEFKFQKVFS